MLCKYKVIVINPFVTDESFLLRFLRHKKYSIPMAQQTLLKYLSLRRYYPEIFKNLDCEDAKLKDILNNG